MIHQQIKKKPSQHPQKPTQVLFYFAVQILNSGQTLTTKADLDTTKSHTELLHVPARLACRVTCI